MAFIPGHCCGLGSLITQTSAIEEQLDPFVNSRSREHLGSWVSRQPTSPWYQLRRPRPIGPVIFARLVDGFCGLNAMDVRRLPTGRPGKATWTAVLAVLHRPRPSASVTRKFEDLKTLSTRQNSLSDAESGEIANYGRNETSTSPVEGDWASLDIQPLTRHGSTTCIVISRTTLITITLLVNGRQMFRYSDASGHRASYASYCGHFYINWPLDSAATISFAPHESHVASTDVYPASFCVRADRCIQMAAGIVSSPDSTFQCAFAGRKNQGDWVLEYQRNGFPGAHGSRHLWNLMGGKVYEVDFLLARRRTDNDTIEDDSMVLNLQSKEAHGVWTLQIPKAEEDIIRRALDFLPWSPMSWSIHRSLRHILVHYAEPTMIKYRASLAAKLRTAVLDHSTTLIKVGWDPEFVRGSMGDIAANSVMAGSGNSGDSVRLVTAAALTPWGSESYEGLDETTFWRNRSIRVDDSEQKGKVDGLDIATVIALTKVFVLEWSVEFDYQMYHDLPPELLWR